MSAPTAEVRYSISEAAELLDRSPQTLRSWDKNRKMPKHLWPKRDNLNHRYWTDELIEEIKQWIQETNFYPGNGIAYQPTPEKLQQHIARIRKSSGSRAGKKQDEQPHDPSPLTHMADMIEDAIKNLGMSQEDITAMLPKVAKDTGVDLGEALHVASEVFARH